MKKYFSYSISFICIVFFIISTGCGSKISLKDMETTTYHHAEGGYQISVPKSWEKKLENEVSVGFMGIEPAVNFNVIYEIGGFDYYSLDKLGEEMISFLGAKIKDLEVLNKIESKDQKEIYQFIAQGTLPDMQEITMKGIIIAPDHGIRYYLIFTTRRTDFDQLKPLIDDITDSFQINKSNSELYLQLLPKNKEDQVDQKDQVD